jgi:hypothetical protein
MAKTNPTTTAQQRWEENHVSPGVPVYLERRVAHDFLCAENKEAGVPVYIEIHKRNKNAGTQTLLIFYKIQIRFPIQMRSADSLLAVI